MEKMRESFYMLEYLVLWSFISTVGGYVILPGWKKKPHIAFGGFITSILGGAIIMTLLGEKWTLLGVFTAAYAGPWIVVYLHQKRNFKFFIENIFRTVERKMNMNNRRKQ